MPQTMTAALHPISAPFRATGLTALAVLLLGLAATATGFGASSSATTVITSVDGSITMFEPPGPDNEPAPSRGVTWTTGNPAVLNLGVLRGQDRKTAALTWRITTNHPAGYEVQLSNATSAPVLKSEDGDEYPDLPMTPAELQETRTGFGIAMGNALLHTQPSVAAVPGGYWGTLGDGGTQGTLYQGIPTDGVVIATQPGPVQEDPYTVNFAANLSISEPVAVDSDTGAESYTGRLQMFTFTI